MNIYNYKMVDLENYLLSIDEKKFVGKQLYDWLYIKRVNNFYDMTNIRKEF